MRDVTEGLSSEGPPDSAAPNHTVVAEPFKFLDQEGNIRDGVTNDAKYEKLDKAKGNAIAAHLYGENAKALCGERRHGILEA